MDFGFPIHACTICPASPPTLAPCCGQPSRASNATPLPPVCWQLPLAATSVDARPCLSRLRGSRWPARLPLPPPLQAPLFPLAPYPPHPCPPPPPQPVPTNRHRGCREDGAAERCCLTRRGGLLAAVVTLHHELRLEDESTLWQPIEPRPPISTAPKCASSSARCPPSAGGTPFPQPPSTSISLPPTLAWAMSSASAVGRWATIIPQLCASSMTPAAVTALTRGAPSLQGPQPIELLPPDSHPTVAMPVTTPPVAG